MRVRNGEIVSSRDYHDHLASARVEGRLGELFAALSAQDAAPARADAATLTAEHPGHAPSQIKILGQTVVRPGRDAPSGRSFSGRAGLSQCSWRRAVRPGLSRACIPRELPARARYRPVALSTTRTVNGG